MSDVISVSDRRLGEMLVREKNITPAQLTRALNEVRGNGPPLSAALVRHGVLEENELVRIIAKKFELPSVDLSKHTFDSTILRLVPSDIAHKYTLIPLARTGNKLTIAMADPGNLIAIDEVSGITSLRIEVVVASDRQVKDKLEKNYISSTTFEDVMQGLGEVFDPNDISVEDEIEEDLSVLDLSKASGDEPVVKLVNLILFDAIQKSASDIHLEPFEKLFRIRFRIDGILYEVMKPPFKLRHAVISRLKILAKMDISERRRPQDGRIKLSLKDGRNIDLRVNITPTHHGEKMVIRILDDTNLQLDMTKLGFEREALEVFTRALHSTEGLVLVTGPTGSGKTTTLYSAMSEVNSVSVNVTTAEDPIEFTLFGIIQHQLNEGAGVSFADLLRSFLRADPDIILVGEIRDFETAEIAIKAAQTGHLVLSTLHTNDAPSTVMRLLNMGIEPYLIASSLRVIVAQRLMRKLCQDCLASVQIETEKLILLGVPPEETAEYDIRRSAGCKACNNTGYKGRIAVYEVLPVTEEICEFILNGASATELKREAIRQGMKTLRMSALTHLKNGLTSIDEVVRVTRTD
jgi:type IV pilus assembly protein PilB